MARPGPWSCFNFLALCDGGPISRDRAAVWAYTETMGTI